MIRRDFFRSLLGLVAGAAGLAVSSAQKAQNPHKELRAPKVPGYRPGRVPVDGGVYQFAYSGPIITYKPANAEEMQRMTRKIEMTIHLTS